MILNTDDNRQWEVLESEYLHKEPWFTARKDHVRLANGNEIENYYVLEYPNWVCTLAITKDGKYVMVRQYRHGLAVTALELCAGVAEKEDASPVVSAQRELLEETGYAGGNWELLMVTSANPGTHTNLTYCFLATDVEKVSEQDLEATEDLSVHLLSLDELKDIMLKDKVMQSMHAATVWKYLAVNRLM